MEQDLNCIQKKHEQRNGCGQGYQNASHGKPAHNWQVYVGWLAKPSPSVFGPHRRSTRLCLLFPQVLHEKLPLQKAVKHLQPIRKGGARTLIPVPITLACRVFFFFYMTWLSSFFKGLDEFRHHGIYIRTLSLRGSKGGLTKKQRGNPSSKGQALIS